MPVDEPGVDELLPTVNDLWCIVLVENLAFGAQSENTSILNRHSLEDAEGVIHGVDGSVVQNQVGLFVFEVARGDCRESQEECE